MLTLYRIHTFHTDDTIKPYTKTVLTLLPNYRGSTDYKLNSTNYLVSQKPKIPWAGAR